MQSLQSKQIKATVTGQSLSAFKRSADLAYQGDKVSRASSSIDKRFQNVNSFFRVTSNKIRPLHYRRYSFLQHRQAKTVAASVFLTETKSKR